MDDAIRHIASEGVSPVVTTPDAITDLGEKRQRSAALSDYRCYVFAGKCIVV
jgi:hypothetical protein